MYSTRQNIRSTSKIEFILYIYNLNRVASNGHNKSNLFEMHYVELRCEYEHMAYSLIQDYSLYVRVQQIVKVFPGVEGTR